MNVAAAARRDERIRPRPGRAVVIASANGIPACDCAMDLLQQGGDPLDAVVAGVNLVEDNPEDHSVGFGGLPNEDGVVELDACVMHGPTHKGGAVAALQNIRNPSSVAKLVMQRTDHVLLVGEGALRFAKAHGFKEQDLLTDEARRIWLRWKEKHSDRDDWIHPEADLEAARFLGRNDVEYTYGTISCMALTPNGDLGGCTTTSGLSYKIPGRVGDSPILGAGLYVDNEVGACGSTGRGEANLINCSSFLVVELMRGGATPEEACKQVLKRVADRTEPRLRNGQGQPSYQLKLYAVRRDGMVGGACMRGDEGRMAVHDGKECRLVGLEGLYPALPLPASLSPTEQQKRS
ncbi:MAG: N(4)-(beta-N-acetylglucosaminyl)-L-asparaginase [Phycisphaerae bacterium]|nr:N(4)-(beta-N-acetylglucosaminyl)-L-asparaginase [Phycisphaerae bacterium]